MPPRLAATLAIAALGAALLAGCGSSSTDSTVTTRGPAGAVAKSCETHAAEAESLRATGVSCKQARRVMYGWQRAGACSAAAGASRSACTSRSYRCAATATDRGAAVSCAREGESIAFVAVRR